MPIFRFDAFLWMRVLLQSHNTWPSFASSKPLSCWALAGGLAHSVQLLSRGAGLIAFTSWGQVSCTNKGEPDAKEILRDGSGRSSSHAGGCARSIGRAGLRHGAPVAEPAQVHQRYRWHGGCHDE